MKGFPPETRLVLLSLVVVFILSNKLYFNSFEINIKCADMLQLDRGLFREPDEKLNTNYFGK